MRTFIEIAFGRRRANPGGGRLKAMLAAVLFGLYYANYVNQWITVTDLDVSRWIF